MRNRGSEINRRSSLGNSKLEGTSTPVNNPLRMEIIETEMMAKDNELIYVDELYYPNGSVYRGQLRPV